MREILGEFMDISGGSSKVISGGKIVKCQKQSLKEYL